MTTLFITWAFLCNGIMFMSLFCYRSGNARRKFYVQCLAMIFMIMALINLARALTGLIYIMPFTVPELLWETVLCALIILCDGNVAKLLPRKSYHEIRN